MSKSNLSPIEQCKLDLYDNINFRDVPGVKCPQHYIYLDCMQEISSKMEKNFPQNEQEWSKEQIEAYKYIITSAEQIHKGMNTYIFYRHLQSEVEKIRTKQLEPDFIRQGLGRLNRFGER